MLKVVTFAMRTAVASDAWWSTCVASCPPSEWPLTESEVSEYLRARDSNVLTASVKRAFEPSARIINIASLVRSFVFVGTVPRNDTCTSFLYALYHTACSAVLSAGWNRYPPRLEGVGA